ncbi:hypothetical protein AXF42_Ash004650 [Apostasia shenzhenica]|uniref:Uncharacterized protein n=1 Tax=Apostasia shenzhenica TaxID=1088818 RepID=A0A2I0BH86_9ASPA|nr:hypothetical protein AXF42_Ash004650 [Apostasia shenzhenica]
MLQQEENVSDSPAKLPLKTAEQKELIVVDETPAGVRLEPGRIRLKDEDIERLFPKFGVPALSQVWGSPEGSVKKIPLVICGLAPLGKPVLLSVKTKKPLFPRLLPAGLRNEEKDKKEEGSKMGRRLRGRRRLRRLLLRLPLALKGQEARRRRGLRRRRGFL